MHDMLEKIIETKRKSLQSRRASLLQRDASQSFSTSQNNQSLAKQKFAPKSFPYSESKFLVQLQKNARLSEREFFIGELKFASPSAGVIGSSAELLSRAKAYEEAGVDAISVITEEHFFHGKQEFVSEVKKTVSIPVLQKDFVIDERQIDEASILGSDALLLIARIVTNEELQQFVEKCLELGIEPVVEAASEEDLAKALQTKARIIAVNARDLDTFEVDVTRACELLKKIPDTYITLGFSGVQTSKEVEQYRNAGAKGVLVGTSLMKAKNIDEYIKMIQARN